MARAYDHIEDPVKRFIHFIGQRVHEINESISALESEKRMWDQMRGVFKLCDRCNGLGELRMVEDQDISRLIKCPTCKGTGRMA